jgi:hypothetical protein
MALCAAHKSGGRDRPPPFGRPAARSPESGTNRARASARASKEHETMQMFDPTARVLDRAQSESDGSFEVVPEKIFDVAGIATCRGISPTPDRGILPTHARQRPRRR